MARRKRRPGSIGLQLMRFGQDRIETYVPGGSSQARDVASGATIHRLEAVPSADDPVAAFLAGSAATDSASEPVVQAKRQPIQPPIASDSPPPVQRQPVQSTRSAINQPTTQPIRRAPQPQPNEPSTERKTPPDLWAILHAHQQNGTEQTDTPATSTPQPIQRRVESPVQPNEPSTERKTPPDLWAILHAHQQNGTTQAGMPSAQTKPTSQQRIQRAAQTQHPIPPRRRAQIQEITPKQKSEGKTFTISEMEPTVAPDVVSRKSDVTEEAPDQLPSSEASLITDSNQTIVDPPRAEASTPNLSKATLQPTSDTTAMQRQAHVADEATPPEATQPDSPDLNIPAENILSADVPSVDTSTVQPNISRREQPTSAPPIEDTSNVEPVATNPLFESIQGEVDFADPVIANTADLSTFDIVDAPIDAAPTPEPRQAPFQPPMSTTETTSIQRQADDAEAVRANTSDPAEADYDFPTFDPEVNAQTERITYIDPQRGNPISASPFSSFMAPRQLPSKPDVFTVNTIGEGLVQAKSMQPEIESIVRQNMSEAAQDDLAWQWDEVHIADTQPTTPVQSVEPRSAPPLQRDQAKPSSVVTPTASADSASIFSDATSTASAASTHPAEPNSPEADLLRLLDLPPDTSIAGLTSSAQAQPPPPPRPVVQRQPNITDEAHEASKASDLPYQTIPLDVALMGGQPAPPPVQRAAVDNALDVSAAVNMSANLASSEDDTHEETDTDNDEVNVDQLAQDVFNKLRHRLRMEQDRRSQK